MARVPRQQSQRNTVAIVDYPRKIGNYKGVLVQAESLVGNYNHIYALIDVDKIIQDNRQASYQLDKAAAEAAGVVVLENNPCFEIWLLLHFVHTGRLFSNCNEVSEQLKMKGRIPNYDKSEKFLKNARLYKNYKTRLTEHALPNARRLEKNRAGQDQLYPRAETFRFFEWYLGNGNNNPK
jgi:hypothetical protein